MEHCKQHTLAKATRSSEPDLLSELDAQIISEQSCVASASQKSIDTSAASTVSTQDEVSTAQTASATSATASTVASTPNLSSEAQATPLSSNDKLAIAQAVTTKAQELVLIDGSSFVYRAFFAARQGFFSKDGLPTGATFLITRMFKSILHDFQGARMLVTFDSREGSQKRKQMYAEYKSNRPPMPDELVVQLPWIERITKALGFTVVNATNGEADDVLGTYAFKGRDAKMKVTICTGDKDLAQLVGHNIVIRDTMKNETYDEAGVLEKYGVPPKLIIDFLALKGDSSDNIPGMKGVGDKTALALLNNLGGIFYIKEHLDRIASLDFRGAKTFAPRFNEQWENILLSYKLATIDCNLEVSHELKDLYYPVPDTDELIEIFTRLGFKQMLQEQLKLKEQQDAFHSQHVEESGGTRPILSDEGHAVMQASSVGYDLKAEIAAQEQKAAASLQKHLSAKESPVFSNVLLDLSAVSTEELANECLNWTHLAEDFKQEDKLREQKIKDSQRKVKKSHKDSEASIDARQSAHDSISLRGTQYSNKALTADYAAEIQALKEQYHTYTSVQDKFILVQEQSTLVELKNRIHKSKQVALFGLSQAPIPPLSICYGLALCPDSEHSYYIPLTPVTTTFNFEQGLDASTLKDILDFIDSESILKIVHDYKELYLRLYFAEKLELSSKNICDLTVMEHTLNSNLSHSLETMSKFHLRYELTTINELLAGPKQKVLFSQLEPEIALKYCAERALVTMQLYAYLQARLERLDFAKQHYALSMQTLRVLCMMERTGAFVDGAELLRQDQLMQEELTRIEQEVFKICGKSFNLGSPKQLAQVLFVDMGIPYPRKRSKDSSGEYSYSTADEVLNDIHEPEALIRLIQKHRHISKLMSTYSGKLPQLIAPSTGRIHTCFNIAGTLTGRLSSSEPNLQNIPARTTEGRQIRHAFSAPEGWNIVAADYSQIELRIVAHLSQEPNLLKAFREGYDIHRATAAEVHNKSIAEVSEQERKQAKATNFGLLYGMGKQGLAKQTGMSVAEAEEYISKYFAKYPHIKSFMAKVLEEAHKSGYVTTLGGNHIVIADINNPTRYKQSAAERTAINAPMQGSAADIIKKAMVAVYNYIQSNNLQDRVRFTLQVHDELVFEVREDFTDEFSHEVQKLMEGVWDLSVPLEVSVGSAKTWDCAH